MATSCCPPGSEPQLNTTYQPKGNVENYKGLPIYSVGTPGGPAIIVSYDIFGLDGGRTKLVCDQFSEAGFFVVLPDYYHGKDDCPTTSQPQGTSGTKAEKAT